MFMHYIYFAFCFRSITDSKVIFSHYVTGVQSLCRNEQVVKGKML